MKTPAEWLKEIKHLSDTEIRHGSSVFLLESDIEKIQQEAYREGAQDGWTISSYRQCNSEQKP